MIEIHCHLLPNIDDGAKSFDESLNAIKKMEDLGYKKIIITPHYIRGTKYNANNKKKYELFLELQEKIKDNNINVELFLGNEIFLDEDVLELLKSGEACTINSSKYLFLELPRNDNINNLEEVIFKLRNRNIVPIIAHPERYIILQKDYALLNDLINRGVLFQVNFESINGKYGKESQKLVKYILKNNLATFIGGDVHHENSVFCDKYLKTKKKIIKLIKEDKFNELININPQKVINNEMIESKLI